MPLGSGRAGTTATAAQRGAVVAVWVGPARAGQTIGPLLASATHGAVGTGTTLVLGGVLAAGLIVIEAVGRFGASREPARVATVGAADASGQPPKVP